MYATLKFADPDNSVVSDAGWIGFVTTMGLMIIVSVAVPQLMGSSWMWRWRRDGLRWDLGLGGHVFGLFTPHRPVKFDVQQVWSAAAT